MKKHFKMNEFLLQFVFISFFILLHSEHVNLLSLKVPPCLFLKSSFVQRRRELKFSIAVLKLFCIFNVILRHTSAQILAG